MWKRGVLIVSAKDCEAELRPARLMRELGRDDFLTVLSEKEAEKVWPDEPVDVVLFSPVFEGGAVLFVSLHHCFGDLVWCWCPMNFMFAGGYMV